MKASTYDNIYHICILIFMFGLVSNLTSPSFDIKFTFLCCVPSVLFYLYANYYKNRIKERPPQKKTNNENFNKLVSWDNYSGIEWREKIIRRRKYRWFIRIKQKLHLKYLILKDRIFRR